jgi:alpha-L-fucosidase
MYKYLKHPFFVKISLIIGFLFPYIASAQPKPSARQLAWQQRELTMFAHFTVNTFTDKEWGEGNESPKIFNPTLFDANQWAKAAKDGGFKMIILTAKHHDGFCLWPSKYTEHSVKNSPWMAGKGDMVKEVAEACKKFGLKFGVYLSPWDRHEASYGTANYNQYYRNQLTELMSNYGEIAEVWFDGAKGENAKDMSYDFESYWKIVRTLQPNAVLFSDIGPDVRWVGNEQGIAGETCWSNINMEGMKIGTSETKRLNEGNQNGKTFLPAESDVSIRKGWFFHESENNTVKTPKQLVDLYYKSVGRNSLFLLNIPPNKQGLLADTDVASIKEFKQILNETFAKNLLPKNYLNGPLIDKNLATAKALKASESLIIDLDKSQAFDRIALQENIAEGQMAAEVLLEFWDGSAWKEMAKTSTIGHKRLLKIKSTNTDKIRITINKAIGTVQLAELGLYRASAKE